MRTIKQRLDDLPNFLAPLRDAATRYFFEGNDRIVSVRGKKKVVGEWTSFTDFLLDELHVSEKLEEELHPPKWDG